MGHIIITSLILKNYKLLGQVCTNKEFTFCFVIDGSGSIRKSDWIWVKNFTARLVESVYSLNNPRISLYQFSHMTRLEVKCGDFAGDLDGLLEHINDLIQIGGSTGIGYAVRDASNYMLNTTACQPNREDLNNVMVVLTDGKENMLSKQEASVFYQQAKAAGITMYGIGVGPDVSPSELLNLSTNANKRFLIEKYDNLTESTALEIYDSVVETYFGEFFYGYMITFLFQFYLIEKLQFHFQIFPCETF